VTNGEVRFVLFALGLLLLAVMFVVAYYVPA